MLLRNGKKRVLVADDDKDFLGVTRAILEFAGFKVDTAENGAEALKEIKRRKYDLLILDIIMPKIDGIKLYKMAKKSKNQPKSNRENSTGLLLEYLILSKPFIKLTKEARTIIAKTIFPSIKGSRCFIEK